MPWSFDNIELDTTMGEKQKKIHEMVVQSLKFIN